MDRILLQRRYVQNVNSNAHRWVSTLVRKCQGQSSNSMICETLERNETL